ncbi:MAG: beta-propeller domain-containing protein [Methylococcales bacterium]|nr:beta-propeller domain-containing protein [Methylococcales bacterium]
MLNHRNKGLLLLASGLLFTVAAQPIFATATVAATVVKPVESKLKPQKITSRLTLANLLMKHKTNRFYSYPYYYNDMAPPLMAEAPVVDKVGGVDSGETAAAPTTSPVSHSDTNIQVQGVDESDIVKVGNDGYIYQIHNGVIRVVKGHPVVELTQTADIVLPDANFTASGIYIKDGKLVVIGSAWQTLAQPDTTGKMAYSYWNWWGGYSQTRALIYDVSDHANPKQIRDVAIDGDYLDSRRIGDNLYFVTRTYPRYYMYGDTSATTIKAADMLPSIVENKAGKMTTRLMNVADLSYFPDFVEPDYVVVASVNLVQPDKAITTKAYLGSGELVYASMQNLYLSASKYNYGGSSDVVPQDSVSTQIYKFGIDKGAVNFAAAGEVGGTPLNQFSMDENSDYFRIATTTQSWYSGTSESHNSLFVLNKDIQTVGKLENLAKGEKIYSTRFMGNRCYIVTFKQLDPLFAIDLTVPEHPFVAGELKIPGYSDYLHPYDENHLIGFGRDAYVTESGSAVPLGLKMALFDVSDMKNPQELYNVSIGDKGTDSPLLSNHKALYWDAEKHLFGFPVDLHELSTSFDSKNPWNYGNGTWQGAYIYEVTPGKGFIEKAKLSQLPITTNVTINYGDYGTYDYGNYFVDRILRIESNLYTLSNNQLNVYDLENFREQSVLAFKR